MNLLNRKLGKYELLKGQNVLARCSVLREPAMSHPQSTDLIPSSMDVGSPGALDAADLDEVEDTQMMSMGSPPPPGPNTSTGSSTSVYFGSKRGRSDRRSQTETPKSNQSNQSVMDRVSWEQVRLGLDRLVSSKSIACYW